MNIKTTRIIFTIGMCLFHFYGTAQNKKVEIDESKILGQATKSNIFEVECVGKKNSPTADLDWVPLLTHKVQKVEHSLPGKEELEALKAEKQILKDNMTGIAGNDDNGGEVPSATPVVGNDFLGNLNNGSSPMDNSIAISDGGIIITVANTTIQYKSTSGSTSYSNSIVDFIDDPEITNVCDPLVLYDAAVDRFIFFAQECSGNSSNSFLLIMFSETNDPADGWNYYKITGNPNGDNSWFDYPKMAVSENELFITGNLFSNFGSFNEPVVYQIEKNDGYSGAELTWQYWNNIPGFPSTILVVPSGNEVNYGPGIYMVSVNQASGNAIKFYDITDDIAGSPSLNYFSISTTGYEVAANSEQMGTSTRLSNGDSRVQSGFFLDGTLHFVHMSDIGSGWNGINYNRIDVAALSNETFRLGDAGTTDYSYPSVAWFGTSPGDKSVMIGFGAANNSIYPQMRAVHCDNAGVWSPTTIVKESTSYVSYTSSTVERWGDYTGIARNYNATTPTVWVNGAYGLSSHIWNTWIAEITAESSVGLSENDMQKKESMLIAPNPVIETAVLTFNVEEDLPVSIQVVGMDGKIVKHLYTGTAYQGKNQFAFNKSNLANGTYFLQIMSNNNQIEYEKVVVQ